MSSFKRHRSLWIVFWRARTSVGKKKLSYLNPIRRAISNLIWFDLVAQELPPWLVINNHNFTRFISIDFIQWWSASCTQTSIPSSISRYVDIHLFITGFCFPAGESQWNPNRPTTLINCIKLRVYANKSLTLEHKPLLSYLTWYRWQPSFVTNHTTA